MANGKVIAFINMKGGVGKTTLCVGIGEYLATCMKKKILFIDVDPQFNTTQSFMDYFDLEDKYMSDYRNNMTIRKLFKTIDSVSERPKMVKPEDVILTFESCQNINLICGDIDLIYDDNKNDSAKLRRIKKFIKDYNLRNVYDFIFIDCPPTISFYTDAAIYAADYYLVPNRIDRYSILGIKLLKKVIDSLSYEDENINIKPLGIVYTMVHDERRKKIERLKREFEETDMVREMTLFKCHTSFVNDLMVGLQGNISSKYNRSREDIAALSQEFLQKIALIERG